MKTEINKRVEWTYTHWLNSKSSTLITKKGLALYKSMRAGYTVVLFDGNKTKSMIRDEQIVYKD